MNDTISRHEAIDALCSICGQRKNCDKSLFRYYGSWDEQVIPCPDHYMLVTLPAVEPEIIHCRDCIHWKSKEYVGNNDIYTADLANLPCKNWSTAGDWYCGSAERREEGDNNGSKMETF